MWWLPGSEYEIETSKRIVTLALRDGVSRDELPRQTTVSRYPDLVFVAGRQPSCLRCKQLGRMGHHCEAFWCRACRGVGHAEGDVRNQNEKADKRSRIRFDNDHDKMEKTKLDDLATAGEATAGVAPAVEKSEPHVEKQPTKAEPGKSDKATMHARAQMEPSSRGHRQARQLCQRGRPLQWGVR